MKTKKLIGKAFDFLNEKLKGQRVFLRHETKIQDENNNLFCYLYIENKTFINAHHIKNRFVKVDNSYDYKNKNKFLKQEYYIH